MKRRIRRPARRIENRRPVQDSEGARLLRVRHEDPSYLSRDTARKLKISRAYVEALMNLTRRPGLELAFRIQRKIGILAELWTVPPVDVATMVSASGPMLPDDAGDDAA